MMIRTVPNLVMHDADSRPSLVLAVGGISPLPAEPTFRKAKQPYPGEREWLQLVRILSPWKGSCTVEESRAVASDERHSLTFRNLQLRGQSSH